MKLKSRIIFPNGKSLILHEVTDPRITIPIKIEVNRDLLNDPENFDSYAVSFSRTELKYMEELKKKRVCKKEMNKK